MTHDETVEFFAGWVNAWRARHADRLTSSYKAKPS